MITLSVCMIVKDEEDVLNRCLLCVKDFADEIVVVDTGSKDKSKDIAKKYTDKVYDFKWCNDFAKARNYSFSKSTKDYTMWLDADDIVTKENIERILNLKKRLSPSVDMVMLKYDVGFDEMGNVNFSYYRERMVKTSKHFKWQGQIHEVIPREGNVVYEDISITHKKIKQANPKRNLEIFEKMKKSNIVLDPRQKFYFARELYYNKQYKKAIKEFNEFINLEDAWIENKISACIDLANCYILTNQIDQAYLSLCKSFLYDLPRAEVCCMIGSIFFTQKNYRLSKYWYKQALSSKMDLTSGAFVYTDCYNYIPYIQLSVCEYYLNNIQKAIMYNELAGDYKPEAKIYLKNKEFYNKVLSDENKIYNKD